MPFTKPLLPYKYDELEPYIDAKTMKMHYEVHHTTYVNKLSPISDDISDNTQLANLLFKISTNNKFSEDIKKILINHGGGHYNHSLFWQFMTPPNTDSKFTMSRSVEERIKKDFGSLENFKNEFKTKSLSVFGSGWCWWVYDTNKKCSLITTTKDQWNPIMENSNLVCMLGLDVWEHAYYLKFQANRGEYIDSWWNVINWNIVSKIHDELIPNNKQVHLLKNGLIDFN